MFKRYLVFIFCIMFFPMISIGNQRAVVWKSTYYRAIPNKKEISATYCQQHMLGTFVGVVDDQLARGAITDRGIELDHFTFHVEMKNGIYFLTGTVRARGRIGEKEWQDEVQYYLYKLTEMGITRGVWSTSECKGLYLGYVVDNIILRD